METAHYRTNTHRSFRSRSLGPNFQSAGRLVGPFVGIFSLLICSDDLELRSPGTGLKVDGIGDVNGAYRPMELLTIDNKATSALCPFETW